MNQIHIFIRIWKSKSIPTPIPITWIKLELIVNLTALPLVKMQKTHKNIDSYLEFSLIAGIGIGLDFGGRKIQVLQMDFKSNFNSIMTRIFWIFSSSKFQIFQLWLNMSI